MVSVWPQRWQPVGGPQDKIWDLVAMVWPIRCRVIIHHLQLWLGAGISLVTPVLVSQDKDLCHVQLHLTWFEPTSECRSWPVVSYLYSGHLPVSLYLGRRFLLLVGPLFHFRQCHSGLVPSRNEHVCTCQWPGHWVWVDYYIIIDWARVLVIVQCHTDDCSLSCKDGAVVCLLDSSRQVVSPFWKGRLMTAAAPTLSFILNPSV